jgi:hypothetical protein
LAGALLWLPAAKTLDPTSSIFSKIAPLAWFLQTYIHDIERQTFPVKLNPIYSDLIPRPFDVESVF